MASSKWWTKSWNPVVGCSSASLGCANCFARDLHNKRHKAFLEGKLQNIAQYAKPFSEVQILPDRLEQPLHWKTPQRVFVCDMGDLFHEDVPDEFIAQVWATMWQCGPSSWILDEPLSCLNKCHTFMILTKRAERMHSLLTSKQFIARVEELTCTSWIDGYPLFPHIWLGVTAENQEQADRRIPHLLRTPAAVRFVSVEPMLGEVDIEKHMSPTECTLCAPDDCEHAGDSECRWVGNVPTARLDWLIAGCESGPKRRPADIDWFRSLRDQCVEAGVPFFLKQAEIDGRLVKMPVLDGVVWGEYPREVTQ